MDARSIYKKAIVISIPVLIGYIFLGMGYGILMAQSGYNFLWTGLFSLSIYSGSLQFALMSLITENTPIVIIAFSSILINFRYLFYGLSFIDDFKKLGKLKYLIIFGLTDETYSILASVKNQVDLNTKEDRKYLIMISVFNHSYWIIGSLLGCLVGSLIPFDFKGIDFSMTALFIVILLNSFHGLKSFIPALIGLGVSTIMLFLIGSENFLVPSLLIIVLLMILLNSKKDGKNGL